MTIPAALFALLIALLLGALYHFVRNGGPGGLIFHMVISILGLVAGHLVGLWRGWILFPIGPLNLGMEVIGALVLLIISDVIIHLSPRLQENT